MYKFLFFLPLSLFKRALSFVTTSRETGKASVDLLPSTDFVPRGARAQMLCRVRWKQLNCQG